MGNLKNHPSADRLDTYDKYPSYYGDDLELVYTPEESVFTLWAPTADRVRLNLYSSGEGGDPEEQLEMDIADDGAWRIHVNRDLKGSFYTFQIEKGGNWLDETPGIWAKAIGVNGNRAAVIDWNETNPEGWDSDHSPELKMYSDIILYELHHRDFSIAPDSGIEHKGKFLALTETGTKTPEGETSGLDHLKELGVTHIHILPSFDFATVDETRLEENKYNWGYDPKNYNVPDGSYSTNPADPVVRIREFKEMVKSLHANGLRIVLDVVYNHTASTDHSNFNLTVPGYFYRQNPDGSYSNASGCGNETASEREMVRHYIIESVKFWAKEYHIDGFRFDLMGVHDIETMNEIRKAVDKVDPTVCLYGEGWAAETPQYPADSLAMKSNISQMAGIAVFSDELRDGLCGPIWEKDRGAFLAGVPGGETSVKFGIVGAITHPQVHCDSVNYSKKPWAEQPTQMISYVSCHDGLCLVDRLKASMPAITPEQLARLDKLAQTVVFTSQGIPFIYAGEEVMRDKQGIDNSYKSPDAVNAIDWRRKTTNADVFTYYKRLIDLRKSHPAFRMGDAEMVRKHLEFLPVEGQNLIAFRLKDHANGDRWGDIIVAFNSRTTPARLEVPVGKYTVVCKDGVIDTRGLGIQTGTEVIVPGQSALIMYK